MWRCLYSLILVILGPFVLLRLLWRSRHVPAYRQHVGERFSLILPSDAPKQVVWIHAVSVGEVVAASPLVASLLASKQVVMVTTMTPTGRHKAAQLWGERVLQSYLPYDYRWAMLRFTRRWQPACLLLMETEIWPNLLAVCQREKIPVFLINARLSAVSARGYARGMPLFRDGLKSIRMTAAQTRRDARRARALGLQRVQVCGNLKYDVTLDSAQIQQALALRERAGPLRIWVAASTHEGEETALLAAYQALREDYPNLRLLLVPRHPDRFNHVARLIRRAGLPYCHRAQLLEQGLSTPVVLGDSMGEMWFYYALADVVFVGGSLVPTGGHSPIEPAMLAKPVLLGPHCFNFTQVVDDFCKNNGAIMIQSSSQLLGTIRRLLNEPAQIRSMGEQAKKVAEARAGACQKILLQLHAELPQIIHAPVLSPSNDDATMRRLQEEMDHQS